MFAACSVEAGVGDRAVCWYGGRVCVAEEGRRDTGREAAVVLTFQTAAAFWPASCQCSSVRRNTVEYNDRCDAAALICAHHDSKALQPSAGRAGSFCTGAVMAAAVMGKEDG